MRILFLVVVFVLSGCASTTKQLDLGYILNQDEFKGTKRYSIPSPGSLDGEGAFSLSRAYVDIFTDVKEDKIATSLAIILHFESWVFINKGESLVLKVDDELIKFTSPSGSRYNRDLLKGVAAIGGGSIYEEAHYPITVEQIKQLAYAKKVEVRVYGSKGYVTREFNSDYFESIKAYYEKFILKNGIHTVS